MGVQLRVSPFDPLAATFESQTAAHRATIESASASPDRLLTELRLNKLLRSRSSG